MDVVAAVSRSASPEFSIETLDLAAPGPGEVLVRMVAVGLCHTDIAAKAIYGDTAVVLGHEGAGIVEAVGDDVTHVTIGDAVVMSFRSCGECEECASGHRSYCSEFTRLNISGQRDDGSVSFTDPDSPVLGSFFGQSAFASYAVASRDNVVRVDPSLDLATAAPFGCGFQTGAGVVANVLQPGPGSSVVVYGAGGVGMAAIMAAKALGTKVVVAVDLSKHRRETARAVGATHVVDGASPTALEEVREATGGGASHALDTTSAPAVITAALAGLAPRGTLVIVGSGTAPFTMLGNDLIVQGKTIRGSIEGDAEPQDFIPRLLEWHRTGRFPVERLITRYPFSEINSAVADAMSGAAIKPVLVF